MGNYRFRFSDMIPNAWFYKLKDMSRGRKQYNSNPLKKKPSSANTTSKNHNNSKHRHSFYYTTEPGRADKFGNSPINSKASDIHFPDPPRKSSKKRSKRKTIYKPSPKLVSSSSNHTDCSCRATANSVWTKAIPVQHSPDYPSSPLENSSEPESHEDVLSESDQEDDAAFLIPNPDSFDYQVASWSTSCNCKFSPSTTDIIFDMDDESFKRNIKKDDGFDSFSDVTLPPILTKPVKFNEEMTHEVTNVKRRSKLDDTKAHRSPSVKIVKGGSIRSSKEPKTNAVTRKSLSNSAGIRLRANSPRIASRKIQADARKSISYSRNKTFSESFAVVKSSVDPQRDFRDSMVEMILENNIRKSKDLEDLLACYLSLNSSEYHDLIIKAFQQLWFDMTDLRL